MLGDPKDNNRLDYYNDVDSFLPYRVSRSRGEDVWVPIIAHAHRQYGAGRSEIASKVLYLSCVMQYPLYGTTMFPVTYRGYWSYGKFAAVKENFHLKVLLNNCSLFFVNRQQSYSRCSLQWSHVNKTR